MARGWPSRSISNGPRPGREGGGAGQHIKEPPRGPMLGREGQRQEGRGMEVEQDIYSVTTFYANNVLARRVLTISLEAHDWYEFERTLVYQELMKYLDNLETRSIPQKKKSAGD